VAVVSNSSPLIALARIQRLDLLPAIFKSVLIPPAVAREIRPSIALELDLDRIILDDLPARRVAEAAGLNVVGTLGILLGAKRAGLINHLRPELDNLLRTQFFLSPQLYAKLVLESGEEDP
jgi:predicted nucleic acid-binding protein